MQQWLEDTPIAYLRPACAMMPRLQAEESLRAVSQLAIGTGTAKKSDAKRTQRRWKRQAQGGRRKARKPASVGEIAAMGIKVHGVSDAQ